jgi:hypothetical protein
MYSGCREESKDEAVLGVKTESWAVPDEGVRLTMEV